MEEQDFQRELNEMLGGVEHSLRQETACTQAVSANAMLGLLSAVDLSALQPRDQRVLDYSFDVFRMACYALGGMPSVLRSIAAAHGMSQAAALVAVIRTLGFLFKFNPASQIQAMLGSAAAAAEPAIAQKEEGLK